VLGGFILTSNVLLQAVKHPGFANPPWSSIDPVSGHVGVLGAIALAALLVTTSRRQGAVAAAAVAVIAVTALGVMLAGWHTLPQVLCPLILISGAALVASSLLDRSRETATNRGWTTDRTGPLMVSVGLCMTTAAGVLLAWSHASDARVLSLMTMLLMFILSIAAVAGVLITVGTLTAQPAPPRDEEASDSSRDGSVVSLADATDESAGGERSAKDEAHERTEGHSSRVANEVQSRRT
jgi:hypothetical protein